LLDNFGIQSLEHFCLIFLKKIYLKEGRTKWIGQPALPRTTPPARRHVGPAVPGPRAHV
jgi:hypothetical protein